MSSPAIIRLLPDQIINKIAAGEVVDRPASVVKELMENALDAGATQIDVNVVDGGVKLISIADNGSGMDRENALLSVERHATSKIRHVDDIERVATLGFRGEALAAIASVSRFELTTRLARELTGTSVRINGGKLEDVREAGCPPGTRIDVRQLFFNVPARRKFLKSFTTELNHIRQVFLLYAMGRPDIGLRLVVDEREVYRLAADSQLEDRIRELYGPEFIRDMRPVDWTDGQWGVRGLVSHARLSRADKTEQYIFINGRPASAPVLGYAISEAYASMLPRGRHPVVFLFVEIPPEEVDVNVHPTKREVRFRHGGRVRDAVLAAIRLALDARHDALASTSTVPEIKGVPAIGDFLAVPDLPVLPAFDYPRRKSATIDHPPPGTPSTTRDQAVEKEEKSSAPAGRSPWQWCRILGQIAHYYVILETDEGMILLDPQSSHERVLYERMMKDVASRKIATQGLLVPETVNLTPVKAGVVRKHLPVLRELGFSVEEFGGETFVVDALPSLLGPVSASDVLSDIATELEEAGASSGSNRVLREHIVQVATRVAVRTTTKLSREELEQLVSDLVMTDLPYTSPRGRPTIIFTSLQELKKKFGRD